MRVCDDSPAVGVSGVTKCDMADTMEHTTGAANTPAGVLAQGRWDGQIYSCRVKWSLLIG